MRKTIPRVVYSALGRRFYVVLRYTLTTVDGNRVWMVAHEKYDVTDDVVRALRDFHGARRRERAAQRRRHVRRVLKRGAELTRKAVRRAR